MFTGGIRTVETQSKLDQSLHLQLCTLFGVLYTGANPTIGIYNASVVNFYNATGSQARFKNKKYFILL
jgi:hypothetical protein